MGHRPSVPVSFLLEVKEYKNNLEIEEGQLEDLQEKDFSEKRDKVIAALRVSIEEAEEFIDSLELW